MRILPEGGSRGACCRFAVAWVADMMSMLFGELCFLPFISSGRSIGPLASDVVYRSLGVSPSDGVVIV